MSNKKSLAPGVEKNVLCRHENTNWLCFFGWGKVSALVVEGGKGKKRRNKNLVVKMVLFLGGEKGKMLRGGSEMNWWASP